MATANQTARQKFLEARKAGVDAVTARKEAYGDIAPAQAGGVVQAQPITPAIQPTPTTPVAQTTPVTPTPTTPTTPTPQVTGADGQKFTQAPVDPTTGLSKPIESTPATLPKETQTGITQTDFQKAKAESEKIKAQNEAQMALNNQQAELKSKERQQMAEEQRIATTPTDTKSILNALVSGVSVPEQNTPAYRIAQNKYKTYQKFATMTPTQLMDNMKMGEIDTATSNLLANNPAYIQAKQEFEKFQKNQSINNMIKSVAGGVTGKIEEVDYYQNASGTVAKKLGINETNAEAFTRIVSNDPETVELTQTVSNIAKQLNALNTERNTAYKELKAQYPTLSTSAIMTLMASRTQQTTDQIDALNSSLSLVQADLKTAMEMAKMEYDATTKDIELQAGLAKEERDMQNSLALSQMQFEQKLAQQAQMASDPTTAIGGVLNQFAELGIVADRDLAWHLAEQKRLGMTVPEYTQKMIADFKAKPLYKSMVDAQMRSLAPEATTVTPDWKQDASGNWYDAKSTVSPAEQIATNSTYLNIPRTGNNVGKDTNNPGNIMGDTEAQRNIALGYGAVGFYKSPNGRTYAVFPNMEAGVQASMADLQAKLSGGSSWATPNTTLEKFASGWVSGPNAPINQNAVANYVKLTGYPKNTPISKIPIDVLAKAIFANEGVDISKSADLSGVIGTGTTGTQYTDQNIADLAYLTELQEKNPTQAAKDMKELGYTARDLANYKSGNVPLTEKQKNASFDIMSAIKDLTDNERYEWNDAVGKFDPTRIIGSQDAEDATVAINNLVAKLTLPNLGVLKGPMSDKDIQFIKEASSKLSTTQSNKSFERNLIDAYNLAARRAGQPEIKALSDLSTDSKSTVGGEAEYSKYE